ncbi:hypothetical protein D9V37_09280 [Nocardioides mangrovicus]|uniref:Uncharacterized protein n=1 Tax=Nocardioides mangrovicus TaxID=2478913 RepID=A0A3L8P440_9ACTN|nr:hypothetical protein [Nocardioides mangrovicus]RLV50045.1 hypothetical protein D9V37_09280 [Nocardioides mangrovicus]
MALRPARSASALVSVLISLALLGLGLAAPATAASPDAARAKAPSHLRLVSKVYDPDSVYSGVTIYDVTFLLKRKGHAYANKRVCLYVKLGKHGLLRGECHRTDAAGHAVLHLGGSGKSVYYIKFKGDRKTKGTSKKVIIHGHKI